MARSIYEKQRLALHIVTGATVFGVLLMLISLSTDRWVVVQIPRGIYRNATNSYVIQHHSGLWRICRTEIYNHTRPFIKRDYCTMTKLFPSETDVKKDLEVDTEIVHYSRTETAFAVIGLIMMGLGHIFVFYALREPRYMFKRLAALMHLFVAVSIFVCVEVVINSVGYERENLPKRLPPQSVIHYGYSFVLAWIVFAFYAIACITFLVCSRKRKGDNAETEREGKENEPVILGR